MTSNTKQGEARENLDEFVQTLAEKGVQFMAAPEDALARGRLWIVGTVPVDAKEEVTEYVRETRIVIIDGTKFETQFQRVGRMEGKRHFHRRIPLRASASVPGIDQIKLSDGIENVRDFVAEDKSPTERSDETAELQALIEELVDAGASAITVLDEIWKMNQAIEMNVYMPAATGLGICGDYAAVELDGETYPLRYTFPQDGLATLQRTSLYVNGKWHGVEPVSPDQGLDNVRELVAEIEPYVARE